MAKQAVLLLAHGTPDTVEDIPEYLRNVVSGRPMPEHVIEEIKHRYSLIGRSPLTEITLEQGKLVEAELAMEGVDAQVYVGMRNWRPYIPDVVRKIRADGVEEVAVICLAPQNSRTSVGLYKRAVQAEAGSLKIDFTEGWADNPLLADAFAERLREAEQKLASETGGPAPVLFTAHSVPCRTVQTPAASEGQPRIWGYLQYKLVGRYRLRLGGGGPGMKTLPEHLVTGGPYAYIRNPMYLGHIIFLVGLALLLHSVLAALVAVASAAFFHVRVKRDEQRLREFFGEAYVAYCGRVRRWVPGLF